MQAEAWATATLEAFLVDRKRAARRAEAEAAAEPERAPAAAAFAGSDLVRQVWGTRRFGSG